MLSLGLGLTVLAAIALIQGNMDRQIHDTLPGEAPSFFFIDVQKSQKDQFDALIHGTPGATDLAEAPMLRGRIVSVNGVEAEKAILDASKASWLRGDRGITYATRCRLGDKLRGKGGGRPITTAWPRISVFKDIADIFGLAGRPHGLERAGPRHRGRGWPRPRTSTGTRWA